MAIKADDIQAQVAPERSAASESAMTQPGRRRKANRYNAPSPEERRHETKKQKFQRVIVPRINNALKGITLLRTGADRTRYEISPGDLERLEKMLHGAVDDVIKAYKKPKSPAPFQFELSNAESDNGER